MRIYNHKVELIIDRPSIQAKNKGAVNLKKQLKEGGVPVETITMMFNTELAQLAFYYPDLARLIGNEEKSYDKVSKKEWQQFKDAVIQHPGASITLKKYLMTTNF